MKKLRIIFVIIYYLIDIQDLSIDITKYGHELSVRSCHFEGREGEGGCVKQSQMEEIEFIE